MSNLIFLMGVRGCGKSTLGLMASVLLNFTYIDLEQSVSSLTGQPDTVYLQTHSIEEYRNLQYELIHKSIAEVESLNKDLELSTIFILPAACIDNQQLMEYFTKKDFPYVIHIEREEIKILEYLKYDDSFDKGTSIIRQKFARFRICSKYTYFNLHSDSTHVEFCSITPRKHRLLYKTIGLKATERDFVVFLLRILGVTRKGMVCIPSHLSNIKDKYTSAMQIEFPNSNLQDILYNFGDAIAGCDLIELNVDLIELIKLGLDDMETYLNRFVATIKRYSGNQPLIFSIKNSLKELDDFLIEYLKVAGMSYELEEDLSLFYLNFLNSARRLGVNYVVLDLELCIPNKSGVNSGVNSSSNTADNTPTNLQQIGVHGGNNPIPGSMGSGSNNNSNNNTNAATTTTTNNNTVVSSSHSSHTDTISPLQANQTPITNTTPPIHRTTNNINDIIILDDNTDATILLFKNFIKRCGLTTVVIGKYHSDWINFWDSNNGGLKIMDFAQTMGITMVRLTSRASVVTDNLKCWNFVKYMAGEYPEILVTAYNTGVLGKLSKILNRVLTPVHTDLNRLTSHTLDMSDDDKLRNYDVQKSLHRAFMVPSYNFYIAGGDVKSHVFPVVHNSAFNRLGLQHRCSNFESTQLDQLFDLTRKTPNFGGALLLSPFSMKAINIADSISEHSRIIGACNVLVAERRWQNPTELTSIKGDNLDWRTFTIMARSALSPVNYASKLRSAFVMGRDGCTTRSAIYAMILLGYTNIMLFDPNLSSSMKLAEHFNTQCPIKIGVTQEEKYFNVVPLTENDVFNGILPSGFQYPTVIINGDPIIDNKFGNTIAIDLPNVWFSSDSGGAVFETTFDPIETPLIKKCLSLLEDGWVAVNGLNFELCSASLQFEYFIGKPAPKSFIKKITLETYSYTRNDTIHDLH